MIYNLPLKPWSIPCHNILQKGAPKGTKFIKWNVHCKIIIDNKGKQNAFSATVNLKILH